MKKNCFAALYALIILLLTSCITTGPVYNRNRELKYVKANPNVQKHDYNLKKLKKNGQQFTFEDENYTIRHGLDVSRHQGKIDWEKVKEQGYDFVFLRLAYRTYGGGVLTFDQNFNEYYEGAKAAGFDIGVYVFSQAISDEEALEEAQIVLDNLKPEDLTMPVVYDPEFIFYDDARTDNVTEEQFNRNTRIFLEKVKDAGFEPIIYSNLTWEFFVFDEDILKNYDIWFAQYTKKPKTPYKFTWWQYSGESDRVEGIENPVDLDLWFVHK